MKFDSKVLGDFNTSLDLEWIETNGLGGYASSTVSGAHSRGIMDLLVAALTSTGWSYGAAFQTG